MEIRPLRSRAEFAAAVALQRETWGANFSEVVPPAILWAVQHVGGIAAGAFDKRNVLLGMVFGVSGVRDGELAHWSDMLAVRPDMRGSGLGIALKRYQRDVLLGLGIRRVFWTFDPLESRNAYINFSKLGVVAREYIREAYGESDSVLHQGIGTDRLIAEWQLDSARVQAALDGAPPDADGGAAEIEIPRNIQELKKTDPDAARDWREKTRGQFEALLARGYIVKGFRSGPAVSSYLLGLPALDS